MLWKETLAAIKGHNPHNFFAINFLKSFQAEVMSPATFTWIEYDFLNKKCRQVERCEWPESIREALPAELSKARDKEGRVYFDGSVFTSGTLREQRMTEKREAEQLPGLCADARMIQEYMNARAPHLFTEAVTKNYPRALSVAESLGPERPNQHTLLLSHIHDQPQPFYSATRKGHTMRLYSSNAIPNLQRDVRAALTPSWSEADLAYCQLAICASLWNIVPVLEFLKQDQKSIWKHLGDVIGIPNPLGQETKRVLKDSLYATCYGKSRLGVQRAVTEGLAKFGIKDGGKRFVQDALVAALFTARNKQILRIKKAGGEHDCYGNWLPTGNGRLARGILAEVAQSYEMSLIAPIFELARATPDFQVLLYQFDGVSVYYGRRKEVWKKKINAAVSAKAQELGIITRLEWKS